MRAYWNMVNGDSDRIHAQENIFTELIRLNRIITAIRWQCAVIYHRRIASISIERSVCTRFFAMNVRMCDMRGTQVLPRKHFGEEK